MEKIVIITMTLMVLLCGSAIADRGINSVPEMQHVSTATTIDAQGNIGSTTDVQWIITSDENGLNAQPPIGDPGLDLADINNAIVYSSSYTEDTYSNGLGLVIYDKTMDIGSSGVQPDQWNIESGKQLGFIGAQGARIYSEESIGVDGIGNWSVTRDALFCRFADTGNIFDFYPFPAYCCYARAGSTIDMNIANVGTRSSDRFIIPSSDTSVALEHDILVTESVDQHPSVGTASAYITIRILEDRGIRLYMPEGESNWVYIESVTSEQLEFSEDSTVNGEISVFEKEMNYQSAYNSIQGTRVFRGINP